MYGLNQAEQILREWESGVSAGQKLTVMQGQTVRMAVAFNYRGPTLYCTLRCSIGKRTLLVFDEIAYGTKSLTLPQSNVFVTYTASADISTSPISPGTDYDIEAKISEYAGQTLVKIDNVIDVIGAVEFQSFAISNYVVV